MDLRARYADKTPVQNIDIVIMVMKIHGISLLFFNEGNVASIAGIMPVIIPANRINNCSDKIIPFIFLIGNPIASINAKDDFLWL